PVAEAYNFVGGERRGGDRYAIHNPAAFDVVVGFGFNASRTIVHDAVTAADECARIWGATPLAERIQSLQDAATRIAACLSTADWAELLTLEQGKVLAESKL